MRSPTADVLAAASHAFAQLGVQWYLFGAQAAILHGAGRLTEDVDVTVAAGSVSTRELVDGLAKVGFELRVIGTDDFIRRTRVVPLSHSPTNVPMDLVLAGPGLDEQFLARVETMDVDGVSVPVACAEDIIAMKVLAGRPRDLEDVEAVIRAKGKDLDERLVRQTLGALEQALDQRDLLPQFERLQRAAGRRPNPS